MLTSRAVDLPVKPVERVLVLDMRLIERLKCAAALRTQAVGLDHVEQNWKIDVVQGSEEGLKRVAEVSQKDANDVQVVLAEEVVLSLQWWTRDLSQLDLFLVDRIKERSEVALVWGLHLFLTFILLVVGHLRNQRLARLALRIVRNVQNVVGRIRELRAQSVKSLPQIVHHVGRRIAENAPTIGHDVAIVEQAKDMSARLVDGGDYYGVLVDFLLKSQIKC